MLRRKLHTPEQYDCSGVDLSYIRNTWSNAPYEIHGPRISHTFCMGISSTLGAQLGTVCEACMFESAQFSLGELVN